MLAILPNAASAQSVPRTDYIHIIMYPGPDQEFAALEAQEIDITDWRLDAYYTNRFSNPPFDTQITLDPYA
jgi:hypothetical protein